MVAACGSSGEVPVDAVGVDVDKSATCTGTFGQDLTSVGFVRFDGTVVAVLPPNDQACPEPNMAHMIVELESGGAVYRMVINVNDEGGGTIHEKTITAPLVGDPWSDGRHTVALDYVTNFTLRNTDFAPMPTADAVALVTQAIDVGAHVSIYATAMGEADSAHLVHRNSTNQDGAIVVGVDGASPTWLLFSFADQTFPLPDAGP